MTALFIEVSYSNILSQDGRIPIHYATANANSLQLLSVIQHYGDPATEDNFDHTYEYYQDHQDDVKIPEWQPKWTLQEIYPRSPSPERKSTYELPSNKSSTGSQPPSPVKQRRRRGNFDIYLAYLV